MLLGTGGNILDCRRQATEGARKVRHTNKPFTFVFTLTRTVLYCTVLYCCRISLKVEDSDEDADVQDNSSPMAKGKAAAAVDSKVLDEWKRANGNNNNNNNKNSKASNNGAQKGPVKVSLANGKDAKSCE